MQLKREVTKLALVRELNRILDIKNIPDMSKNGMQVNNNKRTVSKLAVAVDASMEVFKRSKGYDLLIVHHGLFWKGKKDILGLVKEYVSYLKKNEISLYASHLPLDLHKEYGNNIQIAKMLGLINIKHFGYYHNFPIGFMGSIPKKHKLSEIEAIINNKLDTKSIVLDYGKKIISTIGIVSGGGSSAIYEAIKKDIDLLIIGEAQHHTALIAKDRKINVILGGHYQTETLGVKALGAYIHEKFKIDVKFIDLPTKI